MVMSQVGEQLQFSIFDTEKTVEAMRDSGYKSPTHAIAELIDNSIEADASSIEIFGLSRWEASTGRMTLEEIAVLDNGSGMDSRTLREALRYGSGTRRHRQGIGRFGIGLPNSSMSQATQLDVWSWQSGVTNAIHTRLWISDVEKGIREIPPATQEAIPKRYSDGSQHGFEESGTLVVWSDLDRVDWKRSSTVFRHTEAFLGRIYRRFLCAETERLAQGDARASDVGPRRKIVCIPLEEQDGTVSVLGDHIVRVRPNDPLYLMSGTTCPELFGLGPMFMELTGSPFSVPIKLRAATHQIRVRASYARPHVRDAAHPDASWPEDDKPRDAGHSKWGKHADSNMGVSIMRAHREIDLDSSWMNGNDPRERWWTVEIDIPTELDEVFGVMNNKQSAMTLRRLAQYDWRREALLGEDSAGDVRRRMEEEGDPRVYLLELRRQITNAIGLMRPRVKEAKRPRRRHDQDDEDERADAKASAVIKKRSEEGHAGESDLSEGDGLKEEDLQAHVDSLTSRHHLDKTDALQRIDETIREKYRVRWIQSRQSTAAFFDVEPLPGTIQVALNSGHPVHDGLWELMHAGIEDLEEEDLRDRLREVKAAFRILIYAWARYEEEQSGSARRHARDSRVEWGKCAEDFFDDDDGSLPIVDDV